MNKKIFYLNQTIVAAVSLVVLSGCATSSQLIAIGAVGPGKIPCYIGMASGYLKVYTATEEHDDGDIMYYPHTAYVIYSPEGKRVQSVPNRIGSDDEDPALIALRSGHYTVVADSESDGRVSVPVTIGSARTTVVDLEGKRGRHTSDVDPASAVRTPSGQIVGWKATS